MTAQQSTMNIRISGRIAIRLICTSTSVAAALLPRLHDVSSTYGAAVVAALTILSGSDILDSSKFEIGARTAAAKDGGIAEFTHSIYFHIETQVGA